MNSSWSLRRRLLAALAALAAALFAANAAQNFFAYRAASNRLFDDSMRESAGLLMQLVQHEVGEHGRLLGIELLRAETKPGPHDFRFQVWTPDMQSGYLSAGLATPLVPFDKEGFSVANVDGEMWRAFSLWNPGRTLQVQIAQRQEVRQAQQRQLLSRMIASFVLLVTVATGMIWWIVGASIRPLRQTADSVSRRGEQDLGPVEVSGAPREVRPLLEAMNKLLERIAATLSAERRFTSDAAHELRTPLAAIRANTQVLLGARDVGERDRTASDLIASVDRGTRLVDQLLTLARADSSGISASFQDVDLAAVASEQEEQHRAMARRLGVHLHSQFGPAGMFGDPALLAVMTRNLLDNALRYTPSGGSVRLVTGTTAQGVELTVTDDGPGIPEAQRQKVFERFYRLAGSSASGSGLGLSIAQRIAELHGGQIVLESGVAGRGASVRVTFRGGASGRPDHRAGEAAEGRAGVAPGFKP